MSKPEADGGVAIESTPLLACPFCGSPAEIREAAWTAIEYVRCSNRACPVRPSTYDTTIERYNGMNRDEAKANNISVWNTRHANIGALASERSGDSQQRIVGSSGSGDKA